MRCCRGPSPKFVGTVSMRLPDRASATPSRRVDAQGRTSAPSRSPETGSLARNGRSVAIAGLQAMTAALIALDQSLRLTERLLVLDADGGLEWASAL